MTYAPSVPMGLVGNKDVVMTTGDRDEITAWCKENDVNAFYYGRHMTTKKDYWIVLDPEHNVMFSLRWA